jgi:hypothetical protein
MIMLTSLTTIEAMEVAKVDCTSIKQEAICFGKTR